MFWYKARFRVRAPVVVRAFIDIALCGVIDTCGGCPR